MIDLQLILAVNGVMTSFDNKRVSRNEQPMMPGLDPEFQETERHLRRCVGKLLNNSGFCKHAQEDIFQTSMLKLIESLDQFENRSSLSTYFYSIVKNRIRDHIRNKSRRQKVIVGSLDGLQSDSERSSYEPAAMDLSSLDCAIGNEREDLQRMAIELAIKDLGEDQAKVLHLSIMEHSYEVMADALETELGTVKSRLHRARSSIKRFLEANGDSSLLNLFQD